MTIQKIFMHIHMLFAFFHKASQQQMMVFLTSYLSFLVCMIQGRFLGFLLVSRNYSGDSKAMNDKNQLMHT